MAVTQYIGARYVPIFADPIEWNNTRTYEPLTIVSHNGNSYTSRQSVPRGIDISNKKYWALTGNYNAQVEQYRQEVITGLAKVHQDFDDLSQELTTDFTNLSTQLETDFTNLSAQLDTDFTQLETDLTERINSSLAQTVKIYDNVQAMSQDTTAFTGLIAHTLGFHAPGDAGAATYIISATTAESPAANGMDVIACQNNLIAELVPTQTYYTPETFGAHANGIDDDTAVFDRIFEKILSDQTRDDQEFFAPSLRLSKKYKTGRIEIPAGLNIVKILGDSAEIISGYFEFGENAGWKVNIEGITFTGCEQAIIMHYKNTEYTKIVIKDCIFYKNSVRAIAIARRSAQVIIEQCTFRYCAKSITVNDVDRFYLRNNWFECGSLYPWAGIHYDIEQTAINEGFAEIANNIFIPGITQTNELPVWIRLGSSANIHGNRFSGENGSIHPILIDYDKAENFNWNSSLYPVINIRDNDIFAGTSEILINPSARGAINITGNSGWVNGRRVLNIARSEDVAQFNALDVRRLSIRFGQNTGRTWVADYDSFKSVQSGTVHPALARFIRPPVQYLGNYNAAIQVSADNSTGTLTINTGIVALPNSTILASTGWLACGTINKNPAGSTLYSQNLTLHIGLRRYLDGGEFRIQAVLKQLNDNQDAVSCTALINGASHITASQITADTPLTITIAGAGTAKANWTSCASITDALPAVTTPLYN